MGRKTEKPYVVAGDIWLEPGARSVIEEKKKHTKAKYIEIVTGQLKKTSFAHFRHKLIFKLNSI